MHVATAMENKLQPNALAGELAHGLARLALGLNLLGHGLSRIGHISVFVAATEKTFASTWLPSGAVAFTAYYIPPLETIIGILLVLGLFLRPTLVIGTLLLCQLTFGSSLAGQFEAAGLQLIYVAIYTALLATDNFNRFSLDRLFRNRS